MVAKKGPASSLETGKGGVNADQDTGEHSQNYDVQLHTAENGLEVKTVRAASGDEAAQKVLATEGYREASIRGITVSSDPDANSLGGERDAQVMIDNANNPGAIINTLGTAANAKATEGLGKADISELKD